MTRRDPPSPLVDVSRRIFEDSPREVRGWEWVGGGGQLPLLDVEAFEEVEAAEAAAVADFEAVWVALAEPVDPAALLEADPAAAMQPVSSTVPATPATPTTRRALRAGWGRRLRGVAAGWVLMADRFPWSGARWRALDDPMIRPDPQRILRLASVVPPTSQDDATAAGPTLPA